MANTIITITIPEAEAQRVLDGYGVDNAIDLKALIIEEIKQKVKNTEYKNSIREARDNAVALEL